MNICKGEEHKGKKKKCKPFKNNIMNKKYTDTDMTRCSPCPAFGLLIVLLKIIDVFGQTDTIVSKFMCVRFNLFSVLWFNYLEFGDNKCSMLPVLFWIRFLVQRQLSGPSGQTGQYKGMRHVEQVSESQG